MAKPTLFAVDDDPDVLRALTRDLHAKFGAEYRVRSSDSGQEALTTLKQYKLHNDAVALFLVDQRMPNMTGVEFLEQALDIFPRAKRVLLTAYADTDVAIRAINSVKLDHYLLKPWDPPEAQLYPVVQDLLDDWQSGYYPVNDSIRIIGYRWSREVHDLKDYLARNNIPYTWIDFEKHEEADKLLEYAQADIAQLPIVLLPNGQHLIKPSLSEVAEKLGLKTAAEFPFYDLVVIGGGPGGLAASVYGAYEGLKTVMIEREATGGQAGTSSRIENYLGFPVGLSGADLARRATAQARRFGVEILTPQEAVAIRAEGQFRYVKLANGSEISCHAVLIATGVRYRKMDVPGIDHLLGSGVYYGSTLSEALSVSNHDVYIIGGANSAGQAALFMSQFASNVYLVIRGDSLEKGMSHHVINQITAVKNIVVLLNSNITEVHGDTKLEAVTVSNSATKEKKQVPAEALFIMIGALPATDWLSDLIARDSSGFILTGPQVMENGHRPKGWSVDRDPFMLETSVPRVFAAGDVRYDALRRVASAVGEGSIAITFVTQALKEL